MPIILRGDSGFCRRKLLRWCEKHDVGYVIGIVRNKFLERMAVSVRRIVFHLSSYCPYQQLFALLVRRLTQT